MTILPINRLRKKSQFNVIFFINKHTYRYVVNTALIKSVIPSSYYKTKIERLFKPLI